MADDSVWIEPQTASNGIAQWETAAEGTQSHWNTQTATATGMGSPWGSDEAGKTFAESYGGTELINNPDVAALFSKLVETGANVRTAVNASLASDDVQAKGVTDIIEPGTAPEPR